ncbi:MAG: MBOAT family protein, partial [Lachnospiraceae bacterium]|nr:MBOAT family protein [Lachnospiraceae bacterium]
MVFSSMLFLWIFLPVVLVLGLIFRKPSVQNILLLIASLIFYAWGEPRHLLLLLVSIFINWASGILIDRYRD